MHYLLIFIGAGLGGMARYATGHLMLRYGATAAFPFSTFLVNITGSLLMGVIAGFFATRGDFSSGWKLFFTTGLMGGFTTFSAFSLETILLLERGHYGIAALYAGLSVVLGAAALAAGLFMMRMV